MPEYPPEPWHLAGQAYLSVWTVPRADLPRVPAEVTPVTLGGRAIVWTAWIDYRPPGALAYHELLAAVVVRNGLRATATITEIWVDSEVSLAGGRALWAIPKDLATLEFRHGRGFAAAASTASGWIATAAFVPRGVPAPAPPAGFSIAQAAAEGVRTSAVRSAGRPQPATASWNVNADGPLGYLAGRRPLASGHLKDFRIRFGG
ncbi:acetoacetate decarboxylase [Prauserella shujinwangii]|uniref:Acetoacetate decarboxylase n=1 Tax=Prauserella shujinwangii TaxID=1453103 RepID=A0A2T0LR87_9PSEU|nr:acetoacetate decarboxylase family protein [Prauserella shujinwangii]PRX45998.1 acetoacetate decarboxylase [Prauserella shujinwangii]